MACMHLGKRFYRKLFPLRLGRSRNTGMSQKEIRDYLQEKKNIFGWLIKKGVRDLMKFGKVMNLYYRNKKTLLSAIKNDDTKIIFGQ